MLGSSERETSMEEERGRSVKGGGLFSVGVDCSVDTSSLLSSSVGFPWDLK